MATGFVLGIDAGGSGSRWALADLAGNLESSGNCKALQLVGMTIEEAVDRIVAIVREAQRAAPQSQIAAIVAGLAGAGDAARRRELEAAVGKRLHGDAGLLRIRIVTDLEIAGAQAFPSAPGYAAWSGTGSFVIARDHSGALLRLGGRGYLLGDQGSGFDLVRQAARASLLGLDGIGPPPGELAAALVASFAVPGLARLSAALQRLSPREVAAVAPTVLGFAQSGDARAKEAVQVAFAGLADLVIAMVARVGEPLVTLHVGGSVLRESAVARAALLQALAVRGFTPELVPVRESSALGAVRLGRAWLVSEQPLARWVEDGAA